MKQILIDIVKDIWIDRWDVFLILGILIYRKELLEAFKGGNGKWQMDEVGKGVILIVFYLAFRTEATRNVEYTIFPESFWFAILGSVALISGVNIYQYVSQKKDEKIQQEGTAS